MSVKRFFLTLALVVPYAAGWSAGKAALVAQFLGRGIAVGWKDARRGPA